MLASALYIENWQLAYNSVDYLAQDNAASPFQHFWAMSTQGQFYIIWPALLLVSIILAKYVFKKSVRFIFLITLIIVFISSLVYSIYLTEFNQPWAYFNTFTRVWEFSLGGILALLISNIAIKQSLAKFMGWLGLLGLISCGVLLQVSTVFPGYAALWPTLSAVCILIAGNQGGKYGVHQLLSSKLLVKFGGISYGFYLWHWPLLIFYYNIAGINEVSLTYGIIIITLSIILSHITIKFVEKPIRIKKSSSKSKDAVVSFAFFIPVILLAGCWGFYVKQAQEGHISHIDNINHTGALALNYELDEQSNNDDISFIPSILDVKADLPESYNDGCHQSGEEPEVIECEYGNVTNPNYTVALVGGSHSAHWLPALDIIGKQENIKILNFTKSGCRFTTDFEYLNNANKVALESCKEWNKDLMKVLTKRNIDLIFTTANVARQEGIPQGYIDIWNMLNDKGIAVFAIRDNPVFPFDVPTCIEVNAEASTECTVERSSLLPEEIWNNTGIPDNVHYADLSDYFCEEDVCKPIVGNVLVYRDKNHITATYSKTLAPVLREEIMTVLNDL